MTEELECFALAKLPALSREEQDDAAFRAQDLAWAAVVDAFIQRQENEELTYKGLGDRIERSKSQVQRWLSSAYGMNIRSLGLLAEGLNSDLVIELHPRTDAAVGRNHLHPFQQARSELRNHIRVEDLANQARKLDKKGDVPVSAPHKLMVNYGGNARLLNIYTGDFSASGTDESNVIFLDLASAR
jgi:hypothetical protein